MCLRRAPEKYIAGAALDRAGVDNQLVDGVRLSATHTPAAFYSPETLCFLMFPEAE
jgi:hypothetical protein